MERQVYVYVSSHPALGAPITEIKISDIYSYEDFEPVLTMDDKHFITAYNENVKAGGAAIFVEDDYFLHGNQLSFKREGADKPYIQSIKLAYGDDDLQATTKLLEAGYTDIIKKDLNEDAGGKFVYLGMTRTADEKDAIYDLILTNNTSSPAKNWNQYTLASDIDLNYKAGGKYIYLYQSKTKVLNGGPLTDLKAVDEYYKRPEESANSGTVTTLGAGSVIYKEDYVVNQDLEKQDVNQRAGGDYIYLVMTREIKLNSSIAYLGSMLGTGSIVVIGLFLAAAAGAIVYVKLKKKRESQSVDLAE